MTMISTPGRFDRIVPLLPHSSSQQLLLLVEHDVLAHLRLAWLLQQLKS